MVEVALLVFQNALPASIFDSLHFFEVANRRLKELGEPNLFNVHLVGFNEHVHLNGGVCTIRTAMRFADTEHFNFVIVPALDGHFGGMTYINKECVSWLILQYKSGAEIVGLGTGSFLLAYTGLLNGRECTTHWEYANEFKYFYPSVVLRDDLVFTDHNGIYTSGGTTAYWNLFLHLLEKRTSRALAIQLAKYFLIDIGQQSQSAFIVFQGLKDHGDTIVLQAQKILEENYATKITVAEIADQLHITRRTFERRFRKATSSSVTEYIQRVKIEAARLQLETTKKTVDEIMNAVGYSDIPAFRKIFKRFTGVTPHEYRSRYKL